MMEIIKLNNSWYSRDLALKELKEMFSKSLLKPTYIVAEENGKVLAFGGFIPSWADNMVIDIFWVNIHPDYQSRGIQTKLIKDIVKRLEKMKNPKVKMILISTKIPAFFKRFGFKKLTPKYDKDYILMGKELR